MAAGFGHVIENVNRSDEARGNDCKRLCIGKRGMRKAEPEGGRSARKLKVACRHGARAKAGPPIVF